MFKDEIPIIFHIFAPFESPMHLGSQRVQDFIKA